MTPKGRALPFRLTVRNQPEIQQLFCEVGKVGVNAAQGRILCINRSWLQACDDALCHECGEGADVIFDAGFLQCHHIVGPILDTYDGPWIAARG